jgi:hypothetical protein
MRSPEAMLEEVFHFLFLMHRYQVEATTKLIGGLDYNYKIKVIIKQRIQAKRRPKKAALDALILTIVSPSQLEVPAHVLALIPSKTFVMETRETLFSNSTSFFDHCTSRKCSRF